MLAAGSEVNAQNLAGTSALLALTRRHPIPMSEIRALLAADADPTLCSRQGESPLTVAEQLVERFEDDPAEQAKARKLLKLLQEAKEELHPRRDARTESGANGAEGPPVGVLV